MASPTPPASTTADHDDRAACSQKMMESIIRPLAQCSAEAAFKGISAILHQNDTLQEKNASLKEDLEASDKTNMRIVDRIQAVEAERDQKQVALDRLKEESANGQAKLKQAHDQVAKLTTEITANKEEITNTFKSKQDKEQQLETKNQENSAQKEELRKRGEILKDTRKALEELQQNYDKDHAELVSLRSKAVSLQEVPKSARPALLVILYTVQMFGIGTYALTHVSCPPGLNAFAASLRRHTNWYTNSSDSQSLIRML